MQSVFIIEDKELGSIRVCPNQRARRFTFRRVDGVLQVTAPLPYREEHVRDALEKLRPRLRAMVGRDEERRIGHMIDPRTEIVTADFHFQMVEAPVRHLEFRQRMGSLTCYYARDVDFADAMVQHQLVAAIEESLRQHAKVLFPPRLRAMAEARGLHYASLSIHKTKGRWGSCSSRGCINLSLYLMLLPRHLQDYVMQHELTHLVEMNHGPRFWQLLDEVTGGNARRYREEMRNFETSIS